MRKWFPLILALALCLACTVAMAECDHDEEIVANNDGTHSYVCTLCGEEGRKEECADSCDDSDNACDWCGSTAGEANGYHFDNPTCTVEGGKHVVTCGCGVVIGRYDPSPYPYDDYVHAMWCSYCLGSDSDMQPHSGTGVDNGDGTCTFSCSDCGYSYSGQHPAAAGGGDGFHGVYCHLCSTWLEKEACYEDCYGSDGNCDYEYCGSPVSADAVRHDYDDATCVVSGGKHVRTCTVCGEATVSNDVVCWEYDDMFHKEGCHYCLRNGESTAEEKFHSGSGSDNGDGTCTFSCSDCGYSYTGKHKAAMGCGDGFHGTSCYYCNAWTWTEDCYEDCADQDGECDSCGQPVVRLEHSGEVITTIDGSQCKHVCSACGAAETYEMEWIPSESIPGAGTGHFSICPECSQGGGTSSHTYKFKTTADTHLGECTVCGWVLSKESHTYTDDDDLDCDVCGLVRDCDHGGETVCTPNGSKHDVACARCGEKLKSVALTMEFTATGHSTKCGVCGEVSAEEEHTITYKQSNTTHTPKCDVCGYAAEAEEHVYTDEEDNDCDVCGKTKQCQHSYWFKVPKAATCTESGLRVNYCNLCGKEHGSESIPAKGHDLSTKDMGDYLLETCSRCDYQVRTDKVTEQPEAPVVTDGLQVSDVDMEAEENTVLLPEDTAAVKVFSVAYMENGEAVQPEIAMTVTLALEETELAAIEGLKLVFVLEDGTLLEIPYEVIDGQIVFTAEQLGAFAFIAQ